MVDLRIIVVWPSCQDNTVASGLIQVSKGFLSFFSNILPAGFQLCPAFVGGVPDFFLRNLEFLPEDFHQAVCHDFFCCQGKKRIHKIDMPLDDLVHIVLDIFRVGGDNRAVVMIVGIRKFISLVRNTRIENPVHILPDQPFHMAVRQLCGVALGLTRNGFDAHLIDFSGRSRREDNGKSKLSEESKPQWIILVHIQYTRKANRSVRRILFGQWFVAEVAFILIRK